MKKSIFLGIIALAAVSMTSCSNDEVTLAYPQDDAIEFGTYLGRDALTRGVVLDNGNLANFGVFASYTGESDWASTDGYNFMYNQFVEKSGSDWVYSPKKYWPTNQGDKISFFAYAPYATGATNGISVVSLNDAKDAPVINYTIAAGNLENQADFVADVLMNQVKEGTGSSIDSDGRVVSFNLLHELTRLGFTARLDRTAYDSTAANKTKVNIKSITFLPADEFCTSADYTFATENDIPGTFKRGTWSNFTGAGALDIAKLLNVATPGATELGGYTTPGILVPDTNPVTLFKKNATPVQEYLFLIPRGEAGISADGKVKIAVAYDIVTVDPSLAAGHSVTPATKIIEFPAGSLKQGVAYMFNLTFGLNEIKLEATVVDWAEEDINGNVDWPKVDA